MTPDFFAARARLRASDRARNHPELREYGLRVDPIHESARNGAIPRVYSLDPHRALAWWARHGGPDAA